MNRPEEVYKSFVTIREMLQDRGVDTAPLSAYSYEEIKQLSTARALFYVDVPPSVRVVYNMNPKFKFADVKKLLDDDSFATKILVTPDELKTTNMKQLAEFGNAVEAFDMSELLVNISKHVLVPKHEPIRDEQEIKSILERYGLKSKTQLPLIARNDAMARYLGLHSGELVKITRVSPAAGEYVAYRCCV